jgi:hypothetical protein
VTGGRLVVADWTHGAARAGVFARGARGWQTESEFRLTERLAVRLEGAGGLRVLAGAEAEAAREGADTLVFEQPGRDLPRIDDAELQDLLLAGFWGALSRGLSERGLLRDGEEAAGYVVAPHRFPPALLGSFTAGSAGGRPLRLVAAVHEAAALVLGFLRSEDFRREGFAPGADEPHTICLVVACDEQTVDVACFDYTQEAPARHRILIRDFFQTTCAGMSARLHDCDWLGAFSLLAVAVDDELPAPARSALEAALLALSEGVPVMRRQTPGAPWLKLLGAAHVAFCAAGRAPDAEEYDVAHACHVGLQVDQQHFHPLIDKAAWSQPADVPRPAAQAFRLRGHPGQALRLNLYGGYSTRLSDAVSLGSTTLWQEDLSRLSGSAALTAVVRMDAPGSGELLVGLWPENRVLRRQRFTLPGLVS